ncbi:MAG: hypothetical protein AAGA18_06545 [Verrucomicrobiota bacterium]
MTENSTKEKSQNRRPRSGGRRNSRSKNSRFRNRSTRSNYTRRKSSPKKKSFWEKVLSFFGLDNHSKNGSSKSRSTRPGKNGRNTASAKEKNPRKETKPKTPRVEQDPVEVTTPKLYVGNLSYDLAESDLFDLFSNAGSVKNVEIVRDRNSKSKGFGFVEMQSLDTAKQAVDKYHRYDFMGRQLVVSGAKQN